MVSSIMTLQKMFLPNSLEPVNVILGGKRDLACAIKDLEAVRLSWVIMVDLL